MEGPRRRLGSYWSVCGQPLELEPETKGRYIIFKDGWVGKKTKKALKNFVCGEGGFVFYP